MEIEELKVKFKNKFNGTNLEESLLELKDAGASQMQSVRIIMKELNISLKEVDQIILHSKSWRKEREGTLDFRNRVFDLIKRIFE